nr:hypothetical protein JVH1_8798 [Rhodococcus sp. JVH1]
MAVVPHRHTGEGTMWELPIEGGIPWLVWLLDLVINGS